MPEHTQILVELRGSSSTQQNTKSDGRHVRSGSEQQQIGRRRRLRRRLPLAAVAPPPLRLGDGPPRGGAGAR